MALLPHTDAVLAVSAFLIANNYAARSNPSVCLWNVTADAPSPTAFTYEILRRLEDGVAVHSTVGGGATRRNGQNTDGDLERTQVVLAFALRFDPVAAHPSPSPPTPAAGDARPRAQRCRR